jgi:hypothetical protein
MTAVAANGLDDRLPDLFLDSLFGLYERLDSLDAAIAGSSPFLLVATVTKMLHAVVAVAAAVARIATLFALILDAEWAVTGQDDVFAFAVPAGDFDFHFLALPAADFAQTFAATAIGATVVMTGPDARSLTCQQEAEQKKDSFHDHPFLMA